MRRQVQSFGIAVLLSAAVHAGVPSTVSAQQPNQKAPSRQDIDVITVTGCVQTEADYRKSIASGKGGTANTGAGVGNEYVLRSVQTVDAATLKPTGTSPKNFEEVYALTGDLEHELDKAVGHNVTMSGYVEVEKSSGDSQVKNLPDFKLVGWRSVSDSCPTAAPKS